MIRACIWFLHANMLASSGPHEILIWNLLPVAQSLGQDLFTSFFSVFSSEQSSLLWLTEIHFRRQLPRRARMQEYFHLGWLTCAQCTSSLTSHSANKIHWWINSLLASKGSQKMKVKNWTYFKKLHYVKNRSFNQIANHRFSKM